MTAELLGAAGEMVKGTSAGKVRLEAIGGNEVLVRQVAYGYRHGEAVVEIGCLLCNAVHSYSYYSREAFVGVGTGGIFGTTFISAPDVTVRSLGRQDGQPTYDTADGPLFFAEVEDNNRSLPALIRHLGMLLVNFPNLNGVLGIKADSNKQGDQQYRVLILVEWRVNIGGQRQPHVTELVDFGPAEMTNARRSNAETALQNPLPQVGVKAGVGHGTGAAMPLPDWTRAVGGKDVNDNRVIISISPNLLLQGAYSHAGVGGINGAVLAIPLDMVGADINLAVLCRIFA
jgi:hypothetical protein